VGVKTAVNNKRALAGEVWQRIFGFLISTRRHRDVVLERLGLTPNDAKALNTLQEGEGRSMRSLAEEWLCDASNATWMVDRLEERGLAERRTVPSDRRVKLVQLTPEGARVKQQMLEGMSEPPPELLELDEPELEALLELLAKLPGSDADPFSAGRG
jgi:DNA-binding MarR family transcriptional regulator